MAQDVNLSVAGIWTAPSDFNGSPEGALTDAVNVESRYKNVLEPRRGFEELPDSAIALTHIVRMINFTVDNLDRLIGLTAAGDVNWYNASTDTWTAIPGLSAGIQKPNTLAKSRFIRGNQNLYLTTFEGVLSLASSAGANMLRAGVPTALNLEATTTSDRSGFFSNNEVVRTTGTLSSGTPLVTDIDDTAGIEVGQFIGGFDLTASVTIQDITWTSQVFGSGGNAITLTYENNGPNLPVVVSVVGTAITIQLETDPGSAPVLTAQNIIDEISLFPAAAALVVGETASPMNVQVAQSITSLTGGLDNTIPVGTTVESITPVSVVIQQTGTTAAGSTSLSALASNAGIIAGLLIEGEGIPEGTTVVSISGGGPYTVVMSQSAYLTSTTNIYTFSSPLSVTMSANALASGAQTISFYDGAQVAYRMVFGRVETDVDGNTTTRIGAPSPMAVATNTTPYSTNVTVMGTLPKNSSDELTFVQLYRSDQTAGIDITPLDQMKLVYERELVSGDFSARVITIVDETPDSLRGIPLYTGTDREGILQSNTPPPSAWDIEVFRDFMLYANTTQPSSLSFTILAVGAPNGVQIGDVITITTTGGDVATYTGAAAENTALNEFEVVTSGTPSQNITATANSLIRVINFDEALPVHAVLVSSSTDLPGQIALIGDYPQGTFTVDASLHQSAYDPELNDAQSEINYESNAVYVSKSGEFEAVPSTNVLYIGDSSSPIYRVLALRDYVVVLKGDGIYKILGDSPATLANLPFDLTTKIIGPDTAVKLNSGVWMMSNQGVVAISDAGVEAMSTPIDDQFNEYIGSLYDNLNENSFGIGYESDRKYIFGLPENPIDAFATKEWGFNYVTSAWTNWDRRFYTGFIHSLENKLYVSRADQLNKSISKERKTGTYLDYTDEAVPASIATVVSETEVTLVSIDDLVVGDILYQADDVVSPVIEIDPLTNTVTTQFAMSWVTGDAQILKAIECTMTWKQVFGDNPAYTRQFSEGLLLFKNTRFNRATMGFVTDFSQSTEEVELEGAFLGSWGLFPWGEEPWGGVIKPSSIRYYIPQGKQFGSYLSPTLEIRQGWSNFKLQGISISFENVSQEVGR